MKPLTETGDTTTIKKMKAAAGTLRDREPVRISDYVPDEDGILLSLPEADALGDKLVSTLRESPKGTVLPVSMAGVETRASCIARFLGNPLKAVTGKAPKLEGRHLVLVDSLGGNERDTRLALEDEELTIVVRGAEGPRLLGKIDRAVGETYEVVQGWDEVTSARLADSDLSIKLTAANARVSKLAHLGLLHFAREEMLESGGRRYVYEPVR